jgi:hypothetical protein
VRRYCVECRIHRKTESIGLRHVSNDRTRIKCCGTLIHFYQRTSRSLVSRDEVQGLTFFSSRDPEQGHSHQEGRTHQAGADARHRPHFGQLRGQELEQECQKNSD